MERNMRQIVNEIRNAEWRYRDAQRQMEIATQDLESAKAELREKNPLYLEPLPVLGLPQKTLERLSAKGFNFIWEAAAIIPWSLPQGVGKKTYQDIDNALRNKGIRQLF